MLSVDTGAGNAYPAIQERVVADYLERTPGSHDLHQRARRSLAGGVSGNLRYFAPYPFYTSSASGSRIEDVDGNTYIDSFCANGPLLLGHNHPALTQAACSVRGFGALPLNPAIMVECAEAVREMVPCAEQLRFLNTGTEAVMTAVRCARAFTGRSGVVKFHGHYHGQEDEFLVGIDNSDAVFSAGVPPGANAALRLCRYLDLDSLAALFASDPDIAAVILDPAMHAGGLWGSDPERLAELRELTRRHGIVLIFDEVITGCRLGPGGAQAHYGVTPDLATLAKALAAGEKLAVVAGRSEILSVVDPRAPEGTPRVFQSGTVNDGAVALASACAALREYRELDTRGEYQRLEERTRRVKLTLEHEFRRAGFACQVNQLASMLQIHLGANEMCFETSRGHDGRLLELFYLAMLNQGVLLSLPTSNHIYFSFAHTDQDIEAVLRAIRQAFDTYGFASLAGNVT